ncbi:MAG TPA: thioredoxin family protein [Anaerolineales bacterium]|nr:thioredoxin family protein [Anaerolineales bacterium]
MKIEILGTGCYNCIKLETLIHEVLVELKKGDVDIVRIDDEAYIRKHMPLDELPGLLINGILASVRELPDRETLKGWLQNANAD